MEIKQNQSTVTHFLLLGFQDLHSYRPLVFFLIFLIYLASITGNLLIILIVTTNENLLHCPMYFFLSQLSITDIILSTSVCSTLLPGIWKHNIYVTITGCIAQFFMFGISTFLDCSLLTVMSYDRYLAICKPLHYGAIMNFPFCLKLSVFPWILVFMVSLPVIIMLNNLHFCGSLVIDHFFCDLDPILQLSCSDTNLVQITSLLIGVPETATESLFIIATYIRIFYTILRIPSSTGRQKAFSTCSSHLAVVCTYYGTLIAVYFAPSRGHLFTLNKLLSLLYTIITPLLNPLIYSLKNCEIQTALKKLLHKSPHF